MGGDGMAVLGIAILVASALMIAVPAAIGFFVARAFAKNKNHRWLISTAIALVGVGLGFLAVIATFFESTWSPPNRIVLKTSPEMKHVWIVLLEKPNATNALQWHGSNLPFMSRHTEVEVPASGVVIVNSLEHAFGGQAQAVAADGSMFTSMGGGLVPKELGYNTYLAVARHAFTANNEPNYNELPELREPKAFVQFLQSRGLQP
jgi:hypothetical protein